LLRVPKDRFNHPGKINIVNLSKSAIAGRDNENHRAIFAVLDPAIVLLAAMVQIATP